MLRQHLCHSQIEYLSHWLVDSTLSPNCKLYEPEAGLESYGLEADSEKYSIDLNRKDRAKRYHKSSIFNLQSSIPVYPG